EDGIRDFHVTGVQTCALPIYVDQLLAVAQQEEQQVQHDEEADEEFKSTLANGEHLGGQVLAAGHGPGRYLLAQAVEVAHADTVQIGRASCRASDEELTGDYTT